MIGTIYRVEHKSDGKGPYNHIGWIREDALIKAHTCDMGHPTSVLDFGHYQNEDELSGFTSMRQLFAWFGGWIPVMLRDGFKIKVYRNVEITFASDKQALFTI